MESMSPWIAQKNGGSNFFNYKGFHNLVLVAICDTNHCFTLVDISGYGRGNDASIFSQSEICMDFENGELKFRRQKSYTLKH